MSGHSKWSTIKHKKAATDAKKGTVFGRIAKQIYLAVKKSGIGDENRNPQLRQLLEEARLVNMPLINVRRAIDKALGLMEGQVIEEVDYEGYGPGGVGIIVSCATDNRNRTGGEVRSCFERYGGSLGAPGSVSYMKGIVPAPTIKLADEPASKLKDLIEELNGCEEVIEIWSNLETTNDKTF